MHPPSFHTCPYKPPACGLSAQTGWRDEWNIHHLVLITFGHRKWILIFVTAANLLGPLSGRHEETWVMTGDTNQS